MKPRMILWHPRCPTCGVVEDEPLLVLPPKVDFRAPGDIGPWEKKLEREMYENPHPFTSGLDGVIGRAAIESAANQQEQALRNQRARQAAGANFFTRRRLDPFGWPF